MLPQHFAAMDLTAGGEGPARTPQRPGHDRRLEQALEASTMALYVSVVLLGGFVAVRDSTFTSQEATLGLIWGTTIGLALAHLYAFRVSSRLVRGRAFDHADLESAVAQLVGAASVAVLCTIPVALFPPTSEHDVIRLELAVLLGAAGYFSGRSGGASRLRSLALAIGVLGVGMAVVLTKLALASH